MEEKRSSSSGDVPENWPEEFVYSRTSISAEMPIALLRELLATQNPGDQQIIIPIIDAQRVHPNLKIEVITKDLRYKGFRPHLLAGEKAFLGYSHRGLFTTKFIAKGTELGEYVGCLSLITRERFAEWPRSEYSWFIPFGGLMLVVDPSKVANELVFGNDYRDIRSRPNAKPKLITHRGCYYFGYITTENIDAGEEVLVNYGEHYRFE